MIELVMSMGCSPSSNVAQDLANALMFKLTQLTDLAEAPRLRRLETENSRFAQWMRKRRAIDHDAYGTHARLFDALMYTDDSEKVVVGAEGAENILVTFHRLVGPAWIGMPSVEGAALATAVKLAVQAGRVPHPRSVLPRRQERPRPHAG